MGKNETTKIITAKYICGTVLALICYFMCGCSKEHVHSWVDASCTEPRKCYECGETEGSPLGHDWFYEATCTEGKKCSRCLATEGEPLGHDWQEATCREPKTCLRCKMTEGKKLKHNWREATCTEPKTCIYCGKQEGKTARHTVEYITIVEPTCGEIGLEEGICSVCGEKQSRDIAPTKEHTYGEWKVVLEPTCSKKGKEETSCLTCGYKTSKYTNTIPHLDDGNFVIVKNPTENSAGEKATHCKECGAIVQTITFDLGNIADNYKKMSLGEIGKLDEVYVGLSYVKKMSHLTTALSNVDPQKGYEVIYAFFDFYNSSSSLKNINPGKISCYADGTQVDEVDTYIKVECDRIRELENVDIDGGKQFLTCQNYEVPKGWEELKFFYESKCVWTVTKDEVKEKDFKFSSMYEIGSSTNNPTPVDTVIYSGQYDIEYKGCKIIDHKSYYNGNEKYAIFKYRITNTSSEALSTSLMGYNMRCYQNNYYTDNEVDYVFNDKIDGYTNIFDIDQIETGMSANIYVAFKVNNIKGSSLCMVYDDGYISNSYRGSVSAVFD